MLVYSYSYHYSCRYCYKCWYIVTVIVTAVVIVTNVGIVIVTVIVTDVIVIITVVVIVPDVKVIVTAVVIVTNVGIVIVIITDVIVIVTIVVTVTAVISYSQGWMWCITCLSSVNLCRIFSSGVILLSYSPKRLSMNLLFLSFILNSFRRVSFLWGIKHTLHMRFIPYTLPVFQQ